MPNVASDELSVADALQQYIGETTLPVNVDAYGFADHGLASYGNSLENDGPAIAATHADSPIHNMIANDLEIERLNLFAQTPNAAMVDDRTVSAALNLYSEPDKLADSDYGRRMILAGDSNEAPTLSGFPLSDPLFSIGGDTVRIGSTLVVADPELDHSNSYGGFEISLQRSGGANAEDVFELGSYASGSNLVHFDGAGATIGTIVQNSAGTLKLQFNASATTDAVRDTVRAIAYRSTSVTDDYGAVNLEWALNDNNTGAQGDGGALSAAYISSIDIVPSYFVAVDDDLGGVVSGTPLSITPTALLANDTGNSADTSQIISTTAPSIGTLTDNGSTLDYTSASGASGAASFNYLAMTGDENLISQWRLTSDGSDDAGRNDGTLSSDSAVDDLVFSGNDAVEIPNFDYPAEFTLTFDFKINTVTNNSEEVFFAQGTYGEDNSLIVWMDGSNNGAAPDRVKLYTDFRDSDGTGYHDQSFDISSMQDDGEWHNYAIVVRENTGVSIFIDGVQQDTPSTARGAMPFEPTASVFFGAEEITGGLDFHLANHELGNVRLFNGFDAAVIQANQLNEFSTATVSLTVRNEESLVNNEIVAVQEDGEVIISSVDLLTEDTLDNDPPSAITYTINNAADFGVLSLDGVGMAVGDTFTQQNINDGKLRYVHGGNEIATADTIELSVDDGAGSATELTFEFELKLVNDPPQINSIESDALQYAEGDNEIAVTDTLIVNDADDTEFSSAVIIISSGHIAAEDSLSFTEVGGITGLYDVAAGRLSLSGNATMSDWQTALRSVSYQNSGDHPSVATRTISFVVNDNDDDSSAVFRNIDIIAINDSPMLNDGTLANTQENELAPPGDSIADIFSGQFTDVDGTFSGIAIVGDSTTTQGSWQYSTDTGSNWFDIDTVAASAALSLDENTYLRFLPVTDFNGVAPQLRVIAVDDSHTEAFTNGAVKALVDVSASTAADSPYSTVSATINSTVLPVGPTELTGGIKLNVDGGNDAYLIASHGDAILGGLTAFTIESQFSIDTVSELNALVSYATPAESNVIMLGVENDGAVFIYVDHDRVDAPLLYPQLLDGKKHAIAATWDSINGDLRLYVDGVLAHATTGLAIGYTVEAGTLILAQEQDSPEGSFNAAQLLQGTYYDLRIWNEARSEAEIAQSHRIKIDSGNLPPSLIANWQMDGFDVTGAVVDTVNGSALTVGHVSGAEFSASTPFSEFRVTENAVANTVVGVIVPSVPYITEDLVGDGTFSISGDTGLVRYESGSVIGGANGSWRVDTGNVEVVGSWADSPLGGKPLDLNGNTPGAISQALETQAGKSYQVTFAVSGNFGVATSKALRVSAGATATDFSIEPVDGWNATNLLWAERSMTFVAASDATELKFLSLSSSGSGGALVSDIQVVEIPEAVSTLLSADPSLSYDGATNKFYMPVPSRFDWPDSQAGARAELLYGVPGQLVTIGSAYENNVIHAIAQSVGFNVWVGASDQTDEGDWRWQNGDTDGAHFWSGQGSGEAQNGAYSNWNTSEPNNFGIGEDHLVLFDSNGVWNDERGTLKHPYIIEWDADAILSNNKFSLLSNPNGTFVIDSSSGELRVADGSGLDYATGGSQDVVVRVTDAAGYSYDETITIVVGDVPGPQLTNIESTAVVYLENAAAITVTNTTEISAGNGSQVQSATVAFTSGYFEGKDVLAFSDHGVFSGSWDSATGSFEITGAESDANWQTALRSVTYENTSDDPVAGDRKITITVDDGAGTSNTVERVISVTAVNDAPTTGDSTLAVTEDTPQPLTVSDFEFLDSAEDHPLLSVKIVSAPDHGTLLLSGALVSDDQFVSAADVADGKLIFHPEPDVSGSGYDTISYLVQDDGGTANGGVNLSVATGSITIDVTAARDAAALVTNGISVLRADSHTFDASDIEAIDADVPTAQRIVSLIEEPDYGTVQLNGVVISLNDTFTYADILSGSVTYVSNLTETTDDVLTLSLADAGPDATGSVEATLAITVSESHPQAVADSATVDEDGVVEIQLTANDVMADEPLDPATISIVDMPDHGTLAFDGSGGVEYEHNGSEQSSDSFSYSIADSSGDRSDPATVTITINNINDEPVLTAFSGPASVANEDTVHEITSSMLAAQISHSDAEDITLGAFEVTSVLAGTLSIGADAASATAYAEGSNELVKTDTGVTLNAYWTPDANVNGTVAAFSVRGADSSGDFSVVEIDVAVNISPVNDAPVLRGYESALLRTSEDTLLPISIADLQAASSDVEDTEVEAMKVEALLSGTLLIGANAGSAIPYVADVNDTIDATNHGFWQAEENANGDIEAISVRGVDRDGEVSLELATVIATVSPDNDVPVLAGYESALLTTSEDTLLPISIAGLQATSSDVEDNGIAAMKVEALLSGTLLIGADEETATRYVADVNDTIDATNHGYWQAEENANGDIDAISVRGVDRDGGESLETATVIASITPVNDAPAAVGGSIEIPAGELYSLKLTDFGFSDPVENHQLLAIQLTSLPDIGQLHYLGSPITTGQQITSDAIALEQFQYTPPVGDNGEAVSTHIEFVVRDEGGTEDGGIDLSVESTVLALNMATAEIPPGGDTIKNLHFEVTENTPVGVVIGQIDELNLDPVLTRIGDGAFAEANRPYQDLNRFAADGSALGSDLGSWKVVDGNVDLRGEFWSTGPAGGYAVDLNGGVAGTIEQQIETTPGAAYSLTFALSGNFRAADSPAIAHVEVSAADQRTEFEFGRVADWSEQNLQWQQQTFSFIASDTTTTIAFRSLVAGSYGALIADVEVLEELQFKLLDVDTPFSINADGVVSVVSSLDNETGSRYELDVRAEEASGHSVVFSLPIDVSDVNESPQQQRNATLSAIVGTPHTIDSTYLFAVDEDAQDRAAEALTYTLIIPTGNGGLLLDGVELSAGDSFSQADIDQHRLVYFGRISGSDSFRFELSDGGEDGVASIDNEFHIESYEPLRLNAASSWTVLEGESLQLGRAQLEAVGGYTPAGQLRFDVTVPPLSSVFLDAQTEQVVTHFTMQDLNDGVISLRHAGGEPRLDSTQIELYQIDTDQPKLIDVATIAFNITGVSDAPVGIDSSITTDHDSSWPITIGQLGFDDATENNDLVALRIVETPALGGLLQDSKLVEPGDLVGVETIESGNLRYKPDALFAGTATDAIKFTLIDTGDVENGGANESVQTYTISITVTSDHAPIANADTVVVDEAATSSLLASGASDVTANDTDADTQNSSLLVQVVEAPLYGTLQLNPDGTFVYTHDGSETLSDSFRYRVVDDETEFAEGAGSIARVEIIITPRNDNPTAGLAENHNAFAEEPIQIKLSENLFSDNDTDDELAYSAMLISGAVLPDWLFFDAEKGEFSGTPSSLSIGTLEILVRATDKAGAYAQSSFTLVIEPPIGAALLPDNDDAVPRVTSKKSPATVSASDPETTAETIIPDASMSDALMFSARTAVPEAAPTEFFSANASVPGQIDFDDKVIKHKKAHTIYKPLDDASDGVQLETENVQQVSFQGGSFAIERSNRMLDHLNNSRDDISEIAEQKQLVVSGAVTITAGLSFGYIVMLVRGGVLVGSVVSSLPAWTLIDPVPVLQNFEGAGDDGDESLQSLVEEKITTADLDKAGATSARSERTGRQ